MAKEFETETETNIDMTKFLQSLDALFEKYFSNSSPIVYNYYGCSFNYGDNGKAIALPKERYERNS